MTTYTAFIASLAGLTVTGVARSYDHTPNQLSTADLPALFPRLPEGGLNLETLSTCTDDGNTRTAELVIAIEAANQSTVSDNFSATVTMLDNLESALDTEQQSGGIMPMIEYGILAGNINISDTDYWAVVATVTGTE